MKKQLQCIQFLPCQYFQCYFLEVDREFSTPLFLVCYCFGQYLLQLLRHACKKVKQWESLNATLDQFLMGVVAELPMVPFVL